MKKTVLIAFSGILSFAMLNCWHNKPKEDCVSFNPAMAEVQLIDGDYKIVEGSHWIFSFGMMKDEAAMALRIIKFYKMNKVCYVGRPDPSFMYLLINSNAPSGAYQGEDCVTFNPATTMVKEFSPTDYRIVDGSHAMFAFGDKKQEANDSLYWIKHYGFDHSCFVGRPDPSFSYLRK